MDVRKKAQDLADALLECDEYKKVQEAREEVEQHHAAKVMFRDFQAKQEGLQKKQMEGETISEDEAGELRKLYEVMSVNPYLRNLLEAEFAFSNLMMEIQETLGKALGFTGEQAEESEVEEESTIEAPEKKLWTPGN